MSDKMKKWQKNARDTYKDLKDVDPDRATRQQFLLYASCVALMGYDESREETIQPDPETAAQGNPVLSHGNEVSSHPIDYVPSSRIDELKQESLQHFTFYMQNKSLEQLHHSEHHGAIATDYLRKMLKVDEEIALDLYRAADEEERELIKESYLRVSENML